MIEKFLLFSYDFYYYSIIFKSFIIFHFQATTNRKLKDTVAIELSFVNSNLQLLKEKLSELNSSVEIYQNDSRDPIIPMIPLGLKETKEVNLIQPLSDFIQEHYSEDATLYVDPIADLMDTRQVMDFEKCHKHL